MIFEEMREHQKHQWTCSRIVLSYGTDPGLIPGWRNNHAGMHLALLVMVGSITNVWDEILALLSFDIFIFIFSCFYFYFILNFFFLLSFVLV